MPQYNVTIKDGIAPSIPRRLRNIASSAGRAAVSVKELRTQLSLIGANRAKSSLRGLKTSKDQLANSTFKLVVAETALSRSMDRSLVSINRRITAQRSLAASALNTLRTLRLLAGVTTIAFAAQGLSGIADSYTRLDNRIRSISTSTSNANALQSELFKIADRSRVGVGALTDTFVRFDKALSLTGRSQRQVLQFTETITKSLKIAGKSTQEVESTLLQLSQALNKGNLDGEELRALRENAPIEVMQSLAAALGTNVGALKELGREGRITTDVIFKAVEDLAAPTEERFKRLTRTIGESFTRIGNAFILFFRRLEERTGIFSKFSDSVFFLADNLGTVLKSLQAVTIAFIAFKSASLAASLGVGALSLSFSTLGFGAVAGLSLALGALISFRKDIKTTEADVVRFTNVSRNEALKLADSFVALEDVGNLKEFGNDIVLVRNEAVSLEDQFVVMRDNFLQIFEDVDRAFVETFKALGVTITQGPLKSLRELFNFMLENLATIPTIALSTFRVAFSNISTTVSQVFVNIAAFILKLFTRTLSGITAELRKFIVSVNLLLGQSRFTKAFQIPNSAFQSLTLFEKSFNDATARITKNAEKLNNDLKLTNDKFFSEQLGSTLLQAENDRAKAQQLANDLRRAEFEVERETAEAILDLDRKRARSAQAAANAENKATQNVIQTRQQYLLQSDRILQQYQQQEQQAPAALQAVTQSFADQEANAESYFQTLSAGYTRLLEESSKFTKQVQENLSSAAQGLGEGLAGDKAGFGKFFEGLIKSFIARRNENFFLRLGGASQPKKRETNEGRNLDEIRDAANGAIPEVQSVNLALDVINDQLQRIGQSSSSIRNILPASASQELSAVNQSVSSTVAGIGGISTAFQTSTQEVQKFARTAVSELNKVTQAANEAAAAQAGVGGGDSGGFLGGIGSLFGFMKGGYTGNIGRRNIAGVVHGQEFVMPADATRRNRELLEAMRAGKPLPSRPQIVPTGSVNSTQMKVTIENYGNQNVQTRQVSDEEMLVIVGEVANQAVASNTSKVIVRELDNPNSPVSKAFAKRTNLKRRR